MPTAGEVLIGLGVFFFILRIPLVGGFLMGTLCDDEKRHSNRGRLESR